MHDEAKIKTIRINNILDRQNSVRIILLAVTYSVTPGLLTVVDGTSSPRGAAAPVAVDQWPTYMNTVQRLQVFSIGKSGHRQLDSFGLRTASQRLEHPYRVPYPTEISNSSVCIHGLRVKLPSEPLMFTRAFS